MMILICWKAGILLLWLCASAVTTGQKTQLHFSYITSMTGNFVSSGGIPVVDLALEQINNRTDILPNYTLNYTTILDSQCNGSASLDAFMEHFRGVSQPTYLSLLCCGCSTATIPVAEVSHYWNIPQMAGIAGASVLDNRQRFRGFFRTLPSFEFVGPALAQIARRFEWTQMAIITQRESLFTLVTESLDSIFKSEGRTLDTTATIDLTVRQPFPYNLIFNWVRDYRIIAINANPPIAYAVLCEAYYRNFLSPTYVFLTPSWYSDGWWKEDYGNSSCTPAMLQKVLNNSLAYTPNGYFVSENNQRQTISGLTPNQYEVQYTNLLNMNRYRDMNFTEFILSGSLYDAMWSLAMGLHNASDLLSRNDSSGCDHLPGQLMPLEDFDYQNERMGCVLRKGFSQVHFSGITGDISFNSNGSRIERTVRIQQYHVTANGIVSRETVAKAFIGKNESTFKFERGVTALQLWPGGVPYDGAVRNQLHSNNMGLVIVYSIAACAGLVYTVVCFLFNTLFRHNKYVKLSSPNLNYLIIFGAAILYATVVLYVFSVNNDSQGLLQTILCNIRQWLFSLGYTLCFAVILAKTWRIYSIFNNPTPKKKIPRDWLLLVIVILVMAVDLTIILIGTAISASRLNATLVGDSQHPMRVDDEGITYNDRVFVCVNRGTIIWLAVSYAYKGLLQLVAMFMAFHIRRVKIKALNDSKEIAVIVYINSITLVLLAVVEFALNTYHEVYAALFGLGLIVGATLFLSLVFIPRMVHIYKDPKGENAMDTSSESKPQSIRYTTKMDAIDTDEVAGLKQRVIELEKKLAESVEVKSQKSRRHNM